MRRYGGHPLPENRFLPVAVLLPTGDRIAKAFDFCL
jgi:hypothetical protein